MAARPTRWDRRVTSGPQQTSPSWQVEIAVLAPGETLLRSIICVDLMLDTGTTLFPQLDWASAHGIFGEPPGSGTFLKPITDVASTSPRWVYWDQVRWTTEAYNATAGATTYLGRLTDDSGRIDTRSQLRNNDTLGNSEHVYWAFETAIPIVADAVGIDFSMSSQCLIETAA